MLRLDGIRVVIVDHSEAVDLISELLECQGATVTRSLSPQAAFEAVVRERPDVIIAEIALPEEDGYSLIRRIRLLAPDNGGRTPAVALTGYATDSDREAALAAGFDAYLDKPVEVDDIYDAVERLAARPHRFKEVTNGQRLIPPTDLLSAEMYRTWISFVEAARADLQRTFWNRKVFRAIREMYNTNKKLQEAEGSTNALEWIHEIYGQYVVIVVRRELDTQAKAGSLLRMLFEMEEHHEVLVAHARGGHVPAAYEIRKDREAMERLSKRVVDYGHQVVAHRTKVPDRSLTFDELDKGLRAVRAVMLKYYGVLTGSDLLDATPTPQFDWLAPFRVAWAHTDFDEPDLEEEAELTAEERQASDEQRRRLGFRP